MPDGDSKLPNITVGNAPVSLNVTLGVTTGGDRISPDEVA